MENNDLKNFLNITPLKIPPPDEFMIFKKKMTSLIGLDLTNYKNTQMERRITSLMNKNNITNLADYYNILKDNPDKLNEFINMLTINVTEFFRNSDKFIELETKYIPELLKKNSNLKIWSSGCSVGAEIYTIAMILNKLGILNKCTLIASDFDENAINKAKAGIYSKLEIGNMPLEYKKHFSSLGKDEKFQDEKFQLDKDLISKVLFRKQDLLNSRFDLDFDLILCRNVVIYFTDEAKDHLYENFYKSLRPGGILFIGSSERINTYKEIGFNLRTAFFYQK